MSVYDKKYPTKAMGPIIKAFKWDTNPFQLVGTGGLAVMSYPADIDGLVQVKTFTPRSAYNNTKAVMDRIQKEPDLFFVELKLQNKDGTKLKFFSPEEFTKEAFYRFFDPEQIDMIKFDCVMIFEGSHFKEVSCIYFLSNTELDMNKYQKTLFDDGVHYFEDGKPYKYLKRIFMANKIAEVPNMKVLNDIADFFNSGIGRIYAIQNEMDAATIFYKKYNTFPFDKTRIHNFLISVGLRDMDPTMLPMVSADYNKLIQSEALKFIKKHKLTPEREEKALDIGHGEVIANEDAPLTGGSFLSWLKHPFGQPKAKVVGLKGHGAKGGNILNTYQRHRGRGGAGLGDFLGEVLFSTPQQRQQQGKMIMEKLGDIVAEKANKLK
jgi:hypothetical protein